MVLTEDVLSKEPWGETYHERRMGFNYGWAQEIPRKWDVRIDAQFKLVTDKKQSYWNRGDIVRFNTGYYFHRRNDWRNWFMAQDDYLNYLHKTKYRNKNIPLYARLQLGMVISRYRWTKDKGYKVYYDYGTIVMMLTGSKIGHIRRYYIRTPFEKISRYPYDHIIPYYVKEGINEIPELGRIQEAMYYSNSDKDQFILNMIESFNNPNYAKEKECEYQSHTDLEKTTGTIKLPFQKTFS